MTTTRPRWARAPRRPAAARDPWAFAPIGVVEADQGGTILYANDWFADRLGYTSAEIVGRHMGDLVDPADPLTSVEATRRIAAGELNSIVRRYVGKDGRRVPLVVTAVPQDGRLRGFFTDQTQLQDELARRIRFTEAVLETVDVGIVSCDAHGENVQRNRAAREMVAIGPEQTLEMYTEDGVLLPWRDWPLYRTLRGEAVLPGDYVLGPSGGPYRTVSVRTGQSILDGQVTGAVLAMTDVTEERVAARQLAVERERLTEAQHLAQLGSYTYDLARDEYSFSAELLRIWGLTEATRFRRSHLEGVHPDDLAAAKAFLRTALSATGTTTQNFRIVRPDGEVRHLRATMRIQRGPDGEPLVVHGTHLDVTDLTVAQQDADRANAFFRAVVAASPDPTYVLEVATGRVLWGVDEHGLLGHVAGSRGPGELTHPDDRVRLAASVVATTGLPDGETVHVRTRGLHADGDVRWLSRRLTPFRRSADGAVVEVLGVLRDVTDAVDAESRLTFAAMHDPLTRLPNRPHLMDRLADLLEHGNDVAVLYCDLDGFKRVNDTAGHAAGDLVLVEVASRLREVLRDGDLLARVGGDEFVVVVSPPDGSEDDRAAAVRVASRITEALRDPFVVNGLEHVVSASIGITYGGTSADDVLQDADAAMYLAKRGGRDRVEVFRDSMRADLVERGRVERVLRRALARESSSAPGARLFPAFQPVVSRAGALVGFEALARLVDSEGLFIPPDVFIGLAEDTGLIRPLGTLMLDGACGQLAAWRASYPGLAQVTMSVNVSALQAQDVTLRDDVRRALRRHGLRGSDLVLELTETALLQASAATIAACEDLRADGVGIAIDDFGIGYASLRYLASLPVSSVKIDRSFTSGLPSDGTSVKIVRAIVGLADDLGLGCVVEGVETAEQRDALPCGVHLQGWLTGRPYAAEQIDVPALLTV